MTPEQINAKCAEVMGICAVRYRYWYNGHDCQRPYRSHFKTREEAEESRKGEIEWGCGEVEEWINTDLIPNFTGNPAAAMQFVGCLQSRGWDVRLDGFKFGVWEVAVHNNRTCLAIECGPGLPALICEVGLKALGLWESEEVTK